MIIALMSRLSWEQLVRRSDRWDDDDDDDEGDDYDDDDDDNNDDNDDGFAVMSRVSNLSNEQLVRSGRWEVFISPSAITACW